jgi:fructan beta-fructosidase
MPLHRLLLLLLWCSLSAANHCGARDLLIADFEADSYQGWQVEGAAFGTRPVTGTLPGQHPVVGYLGQGLVNSFRDGDGTTGSLISPSFKIEQDYVSFLVGGGRHPGETEIQLLIKGRVARHATGEDSEELLWQNWEVKEFNGQDARIRIIDNSTGGWGHINVDNIIQTDQLRTRVDSSRLAEYRQSPEYYRELYRPQFHFTPEINWMNDPNGLVYFEGEWHLLYQYNPFGNVWGHMSWGHAVSKDLVHWEHLPLALPEEDGTMIFSGCVVVDKKNSSGFGEGSKPPLVAIYTGHRSDNQSQCLAYSNDRGRTWTKYAQNPVLDIGETNFRDPKVFWHTPTNRWIMVVSMATKHYVQFYASADLKHWEHLSDFGPAGAPNVPNWECPDVFELPIENHPGESRWVLEVDIGDNSVAGGSGGQYFVGTFDGSKFTCDEPRDHVHWVDYGRDFYAAVSFSDVPQSDGRSIWIGWMNNWETHLLPTHPWRSAQSLPRTLSLRETPAGLRLIQHPVAELKSLREKHFSEQDKVIDAQSPLSIPGLAGQRLEIIARFAVDDSSGFGLRVAQGPNEQTVVGYDKASATMYVDRTHSGVVDFHPAFPGTHEAPLPADEGQVTLHVFLDHSSVEVFGNDGYSTITDRIFPDPNSVGVEFFSEGGAAKLISCDAWTLQSIWRH